MQSRPRRPMGMTAFIIVWLGQLVSVLASNMTGFAITLWAFEKTGQATSLAVLQVIFMVPFLVISPLAGVMVDRYNRKLMMMISDLGGGLATLVIFLLAINGKLEIWHLFPVNFIIGMSSAFHWPAYSASISLMVPKEQYGRVNGLMMLVDAGPAVVAPLLAGALMGFIGFQGILLIDIATFVFAIGMLLMVFIPQPVQTEEGRKAQGSWLHEAAYGFRYIFERPSLLGLQLVFLFANFFAGIGFAVQAPMVLSRTGNNEIIFGSVQTAGAVGGILGGVIMGAWGGFKRRANGVLFGWIGSGLFGLALLGAGRNLWVWIPAIAVGHMIGQVVNASNQAIWQAKVAPDLQGRVFSARRLIAWITTPITPLIGAPLADYVLEPAMRAGGGFAALFSPLVGSGAGAGMGLVMFFAGIFAALVGVAGFFFPAVRDAESLLPDHDQDAKQPAEG